MYRVLLLLFAISVCVASPVGATEQGITREQADAILKELQEIRKTLEKMQQQPVPRRARPALPRTGKIATRGRPALGKADAPVTLVEFVDYQCPYCQRFFKNTYPRLKQKYLDSGKLRIVVKDLPLGFHQHAKKAAIAAHCAGDQGNYWAMHDKLFNNFNRLAEAQLIEHAAGLGLDDKAFRSCLNSGKHDEAIAKDMTDASTAGITGTPSFIVGKTSADVIAGAQIRGAQPLIVFERQIEQLLNK